MNDPVEVAYDVLIEPLGIDDVPHLEQFRAAILAFLKACEGEAGVEAMARAMCVYQDHDPDRELESVGKDGRPVVIWMHWKGEARAALRALADLAGAETKP